MNRRSEEVAAESKLVLSLIRKGSTKAAACRKVGVSVKAFDRRMESDPRLLLEYEAARGKQRTIERRAVPEFTAFRKTYFGRETPAHQREWLDLIENRDGTSLILVPPGHGKTSLCEEYICARICEDPNVKVLYISKSQSAAEDRLWRISTLLTEEHEYRDREANLIADYGPFKAARSDANLPWTRKMIYVYGTDATGRDATVEAVGIGNQIQGNRADLIVIDDAFTLENQLTEGEREKQLRWLSQTVRSRRTPGRPFQIIIIGTRAHPTDNYSVLLENPTVRSIVQSAILDEERQEVLWPEGVPYPELDRIREEMAGDRNEAGFLLTFQQQATDLPDAPFRLDVLEESKVHDPDYRLGTVPRGLVPVIGIDPAVQGTCAIVVLGYDRATRTRYVLDCITATRLTSNDRIKAFLYEACETYQPRIVVAEHASQQIGMWNDKDVDTFMRSRSIRFITQNTPAEKWDTNVGVTVVASRFEARQMRVMWNQGGSVKGAMRPLLDELASWRAEPGRKQTQDRVMALWLAERGVMKLERAPDPKLRNRQTTAPRWVADSWKAPTWVA